MFNTTIDSGPTALPTDVLPIVASYLRPRELARILLVSRTWRSTLDTQAEWSTQAKRTDCYSCPILQISLRSYQVNIPDVYFRTAELGVENPAYLDCRHKPIGFDSELLQLITEYAQETHPYAKRFFSHPHPANCYGRAEWIASGLGDPGVEPPLPRAIQEHLSRPCPFERGRSIRHYQSLVLIPSSIKKIVDRQLTTLPFCLNTLLEVANEGPTRNQTWMNLPSSLRQQRVKNAHWILVTNWREFLRHRAYTTKPYLIHIFTTALLKQRFHNNCNAMTPYSPCYEETNEGQIYLDYNENRVFAIARRDSESNGYATRTL